MTDVVNRGWRYAALNPQIAFERATAPFGTTITYSATMRDGWPIHPVTGQPWPVLPTGSLADSSNSGWLRRSVLAGGAALVLVGVGLIWWVRGQVLADRDQARKSVAAAWHARQDAEDEWTTTEGERALWRIREERKARVRKRLAHRAARRRTPQRKAA